MSATRLFVPKIDQRTWRDPFTALGLKPPPGEGGAGFQVHECGAMNHGPEWNHHDVCSPFWRLYHDAKPGAWVESGGRRVALGPDKFVLVPDGVPFNCGSSGVVPHLWIHFSLYLSLIRPTVAIMEVPVTRTTAGVVKELQNLVANRQTTPVAAYAAALLHIVFAEAWPEGFETAPPRLRKVLTWVQHSLAAEITNELLAAQAGLSVEAFIRWFKLNTGRTPAVYVAEIRIREACRRLAYAEESIEHIAEAVGFANRHHFSRVFKRYAGCGPAEFRRGRN